jgi:hypothetical protein
MQVLPLALFLVILELTAGSFLTLFLLDVRGDTSRGFVLFQGALYFVFAIITVLAMNKVTPAQPGQYGLDANWIRAQGPFIVSFTLLMIPWNVLLWRDRQQRKPGKRGTAEPAPPMPRLRLARFILGGMVSLLGMLALFVEGMGFRPLADSHLGGAFVVLAFLAGGIALGGVMTAMLLGHWYLNTPTASGKPLEFVTVLLLAALAFELAFTLGFGPATAHATIPTVSVAPGTTIQTTGGHLVIATATPGPENALPAQPEQRVEPLGTGAMRWLEFILGFGAPLALGAVALYLTRGRSFQSATGMLYLCVAFVFIGEILGRGLLLFPVLFS